MNAPKADGVSPEVLRQRISEALLIAAQHHSVMEGPIERSYKSAGFVLEALFGKSPVAVVRRWWIERDHGELVAGPFTTMDDALVARSWVERYLAPETFWIREAK